MKSGRTAAALTLALLTGCGGGTTEPAQGLAGTWTLQMSNLQDASLVTCPASVTATLTLTQTGAKTFVGTYTSGGAACNRPAPQGPFIILGTQGMVQSGTIGGSGVSFVLTPAFFGFGGQSSGGSLSGSVQGTVEVVGPGQVQVTGSWTATKQ